jgi:hypothetical protein
MLDLRGFWQKISGIITPFLEKASSLSVKVCNNDFYRVIHLKTVIKKVPSCAVGALSTNFNILAQTIYKWWIWRSFNLKGIKNTKLQTQDFILILILIFNWVPFWNGLWQEVTVRLNFFVFSKRGSKRYKNEPCSSFLSQTVSKWYPDEDKVTVFNPINAYAIKHWCTILAGRYQE